MNVTVLLRRIVAVAALFAALFSPGETRAEVRSLTILHTNDLHARLIPDDDGRGGFAQMAAAIAQERAHSPGALVLHAGDFVQGTPVSTLFKGLPVIEVANTLGVDIHTLGNHEFDYGWQQTKKFIETGKFATISANIADKDGNLLAPPYAIRTVNGVRVGVIGVVTEQLAALTRAEFRGPWAAQPLVATIRRYAAELRPNTDLIVILAHCFDDEDDKMLRELPEIPVLVSGHNHGGAREVKVIDGRIGMKVRAWGHELGRLDLDYDLDARRVVSYDWKRIAVGAETHKPAPETLKLVEHWEQQVAEIVDQPIGVSRTAMRKAELQALIEQVMREAVGADIGYMNGGGIRAGLSPGQVTRRHIWNILPFGTELVYGRLRGDQMPQEILERQPIERTRTYVVATNSFTAEKWAEQGIVLDQRGELVRELVIEWIQKRGDAGF